MAVQGPSNGTLSQKTLNGIYWKTFVGFVNNNGQRSTDRTRDHVSQPKLERREGSFEYMELTPRDIGSQQSESESTCSSTDHSLSDTGAKDERVTPMYAVLDMSRGKEIPINDEITIFDGSPSDRIACIRPVAVTFTTLPASPKCSPVLHVDIPRQLSSSPLSPIRGEIQRRVSEEDKLFTDKDEVPYEEDSFDRLESTSPSMEPAPWKDHGLSIQRWMVPSILFRDADEFVAIRDPVPMTEYENCHYVPTLEAIMEDSEEWAESQDEISTRGFPKSASFSESASALEDNKDQGAERWDSAGDLTNCSQSQDDLFSITSTYGSVGSLRKVGTFENLSLDPAESEGETDGSSDELDRVGNTVSDHADLMTTMKAGKEISQGFLPENDCDDGDDIQDVTGFTEPPSASEFLTLPHVPSDVSSEFSSVGNLESSREVIPASSSQSLLENCSELQSSGRGSPTPASSTGSLNGKITEAVINPASKIRKDSDAIRRDSGVDDVTSEPPDESGSVSSKKDFITHEQPAEIIIPGLPDELYIDKEDIPKIVVMFAKEELEKERLAQQALIGQKSDEVGGAYDDEDLVRYRERSATYDPDGIQYSTYTSRDAVPRRIKQIKSSDSSRLSTLSSSTPELSAVPDDALLYIPVSYASEAAAKRKKKRRATMSVTEGSSRARGRALQTKALISGTGLGNGFSSLRKKLKSRRSTGGSLRRSNSEKPNLSHSSPDVSSPITKLLGSPRRRSQRKLSSLESPPKVEGQRRGIRSVVSNIFRRLGSRFTFQTRPPVTSDQVAEQNSTRKRSLTAVKEETNASESVSVYSSARGSLTTPTTADKHIGPSPRRVSCVVFGSNALEKVAADFRQRSSSVPSRPLSKTPSSNYASADSDVFESMHSAEDSNSLDRTIYV